MNASLDPDILEKVRAILRRDLKLAPDEPLPAEMPFAGGSVDLDSLDMLLLLTSIEKQFGVKITSHEVGKQAFQSVESLVRYVQGNGQPVDWLARLPHGPEFRFITRVIEVRPGDLARAAWAVDGGEAFFAGHFPGAPMVPGVLIAEALAQTAGLAGAADGPGMLAHVDLRFQQPVAPPAEIELSAKLSRLLGSLQMFDVVAQVGETILARGSITLHRPGIT